MRSRYSSAARAQKRSWPARRGIRPGCQAAAREFPPGLLPHRDHQHCGAPRRTRNRIRGTRRRPATGAASQCKRGLRRAAAIAPKAHETDPAVDRLNCCRAAAFGRTVVDIVPAATNGANRLPPSVRYTAEATGGVFGHSSEPTRRSDDAAPPRGTDGLSTHRWRR